MTLQTLLREIDSGTLIQVALDFIDKKISLYPSRDSFEQEPTMYTRPAVYQPSPLFSAFDSLCRALQSQPGKRLQGNVLDRIMTTAQSVIHSVEGNNSV